MTGQAEIHAIPDAGKFGVVIHFFRVQRDTGQEGECLAEVCKGKAANERFAGLVHLPIVRMTHRGLLLFCVPERAKSVPLVINNASDRLIGKKT